MGSQINVRVHFLKQNQLIYTESYSYYNTRVGTEVFEIQGLYDQIIVCFTKEFFKTDELACKFCKIELEQSILDNTYIRKNV